MNTQAWECPFSGNVLSKLSSLPQEGPQLAYLQEQESFKENSEQKNILEAASPEAQQLFTRNLREQGIAADIPLYLNSTLGKGTIFNACVIYDSHDSVPKIAISDNMNKIAQLSARFNFITCTIPIIGSSKVLEITASSEAMQNIIRSAFDHEFKHYTSHGMRDNYHENKVFERSYCFFQCGMFATASKAFYRTRLTARLNPNKTYWLMTSGVIFSLMGLLMAPSFKKLYTRKKQEIEADENVQNTIEKLQAAVLDYEIGQIHFNFRVGQGLQKMTSREKVGLYYLANGFDDSHLSHEERRIRFQKRLQNLKKVERRICDIEPVTIVVSDRKTKQVIGKFEYTYKGFVFRKETGPMSLKIDDSKMNEDIQFTGNN